MGSHRTAQHPFTCFDALRKATKTADYPCVWLLVDRSAFHWSGNKFTLFFSECLWRWSCTGWSKSDTTHSWHMFCLSKNKLHWNQKTKNNLILSVVNVHCVQRCMHSPFSSCLMQLGKEFLQWCRRFTRRDIVDLFCTGESGNVSLNSFWQVK
jgi:hypothetical protein